uniref:Uncharacterized protein n=1 Tax=Ditylenchus dipsaci TaxID=166011 RepID=A0A915D3H0_9BILA
MLAKQPSAVAEVFPNSSTQETEIKRAWTASKSGERLGLIITRRMLHFPEQIAGPAFQSISEDIKNMPEVSATSTGQKPKKQGFAKRLGKAAKKQLAAAKLADADVCSIMLKKNCCFSQPMLCFNTPVHTDVEKTSKFHSTVRDGVTYRPYRRVCLLTLKQLVDFAENVVKIILHRSKS